jgi:hypothetical protein
MTYQIRPQKIRLPARDHPERPRKQHPQPDKEEDDQKFPAQFLPMAMKN